MLIILNNNYPRDITLVNSHQRCPLGFYLYGPSHCIVIILYTFFYTIIFVLNGLLCWYPIYFGYFLYEHELFITLVSDLDHNIMNKKFFLTSLIIFGMPSYSMSFSLGYGIHNNPCFIIPWRLIHLSYRQWRIYIDLPSSFIEEWIMITTFITNIWYHGPCLIMVSIYKTWFPIVVHNLIPPYFPAN